MQDTNKTQNTNSTDEALSTAVPGTPQANSANLPEPATAGQIEQGPVSAISAEISKDKEELREIANSPLEEVEIPKELKNIVHVSPHASEPKIDHNARLAGVTRTKATLPVINTPTGNITMPMNYFQAQIKKNSTPLSDPIHWLASMIMYEFAKYNPEIVKNANNKVNNIK